MPTDRSLNRVKKISRSRFGQQTLHIAKEEISLLASRENTNYPTHQRPAPSRRWHAQKRGAQSVQGRIRHKRRPSRMRRAPAIYSVPRLSRLRPALRR
jgi:hypothetical protein